MGLANFSGADRYMELHNKYSSLSWHHWRRRHFWRSKLYSRLASYYNRKAHSEFTLG